MNIMNMIRLISLFSLLSLPTATFTNCAPLPRANSLPVTELYADPPDIVANNQPLTFRVGFTVPPNTIVPYALVEISAKWNGLVTSTVRTNLNDYIQTPLLPGSSHTFEDSRIFPTGLWGRVAVEINLYNASGSQLLCARWIVFATGTEMNETSWLWSTLYSN